MIYLQARTEKSRVMIYLAPLIAVGAAILSGAVLFSILDTDPYAALYTFFIAPLTNVHGWTELTVKATPLTLIAIGLSFGFRANVWNIGAEGQFIIGALAGGAVALWLHGMDNIFVLPAMMFAGVVAGMLWACIPAGLRIFWNANEILTSLMLTYVAIHILGYLIHGPMKDPDGFNFPESRLLHDAALLPVLVENSRMHFGSILAVIAVLAGWLVMGRHIIGFQFRVVGLSPKASSYAGFRSRKLILTAFLIAGGAAGLAGIGEVAGPLQQIVPSLAVGYGFTAIIVAFLGRLHPFGILLAALLMALTYLGSELMQIERKLPNAVSSVFQGMILFFLLACDVFITYKIRWRK